MYIVWYMVERTTQLLKTSKRLQKNRQNGNKSQISLQTFSTFRITLKNIQLVPYCNHSRIHLLFLFLFLLLLFLLLLLLPPLDELLSLRRARLSHFFADR